MTRHPRREFLWRTLAACGTVLVVPARPSAGAQDVRPDRAALASASYLGNQAEAARAIGEAYLRQLDRDASRESILAVTRGTLNAIDRARDEANAIRALTRAVRRDFEQGRTIQLEGWILSRTEADICALTLLR